MGPLNGAVASAIGAVSSVTAPTTSAVPATANPKSGNTWSRPRAKAGDNGVATRETAIAVLMMADLYFNMVPSQERRLR